FYLSDLALVRSGWRFVDFFFVLSGFVITHGYRNKLIDFRDMLSFVRKRFLRLYPLHLFTFLLFLVWIPLVDTSRMILTMRFSEFHWINWFGDLSFGRIIAHLSLFQGFLGSWENVRFNIPSWSISVEFWTYVVFALCCLIHRNGFLVSQLVLGLI